MNLTELEKKVYDYIKRNTDIESVECVDINDLVSGLNESAKVLRGVISSLVKKNLIEVEEWESNFEKNQYYWTMEDINNR